MSNKGDEPDIKVLMVCLGNICRSPMAEAVFAARARLTPLAPRIKIDSCGTAAYHVGETPDERTVATCRKHGVPIDSRARALNAADFRNFTHIIAMDTNNLRNVLAARPPHTPAKIHLFSSFSHDPLIANASPPKSIVDPYYGGINGFETCYEQCVDFSDGFLEMLADGRLDGVQGGGAGFCQGNQEGEEGGVVIHRRHVSGYLHDIGSLHLHLKTSF